MTVLVLSLQLGAALRFLWRDDTAKPYRLDAVHMGLALQVGGRARAGAGAVGCGEEWVVIPAQMKPNPALKSEEESRQCLVGAGGWAGRLFCFVGTHDGGDLKPARMAGP